MDTSGTSWIVASVLILALAVGLAAWLYVRQRKQTLRLKNRFGTEYDRTVDTLGGRGKAESELKAREKRVRSLTLTPLAAAESARFTQAWNALQGRFIDNPKGALVDADQLVRDLLMKRGYPAADFEMNAADVSVNHSSVVATYRKARAISIRDQRGEADTEELRQAVVHYRTLFNELLSVADPEQVATEPAALQAH